MSAFLATALAMLSATAHAAESIDELGTSPVFSVARTSLAAEFAQSLRPFRVRVPRAVAHLAACSASVTIAAAQPADADRKATPFLPVADEPAPELFVDPPLAAPLARGAVIIPYRTRYFRILPIFGAGAADVSPRAGHLHVSVDDLPWRWADAGDNESVVVVGLPPGPHKILIELATPEHVVVAGKAVSFIVPATPKAAAPAEAAHQH